MPTFWDLPTKTIDLGNGNTVTVKKLTFADGQAPRQFTPRQPDTSGFIRNTQAPAQGFIKKQFSAKPEAPAHKPFAKALKQTTPVSEERVIVKDKEIHTHEVTVKASSQLKNLLDAIDGAPTDIEVEDSAPKPPAPFSGEKPLRESIPPVKHAERGPTEKNKDLLRAALQGISKPVSAPAQKNNEQSEQPRAPLSTEVSQEDLKKVLE